MNSRNSRSARMPRTRRPCDTRWMRTTWSLPRASPKTLHCRPGVVILEANSTAVETPPMAVGATRSAMQRVIAAPTLRRAASRSASIRACQTSSAAGGSPVIFRSAGRCALGTVCVQRCAQGSVEERTTARAVRATVAARRRRAGAIARAPATGIAARTTARSASRRTNEATSVTLERPSLTAARTAPTPSCARRSPGVRPSLRPPCGPPHPCPSGDGTTSCAGTCSCRH